jgi:flagellar biosynthetic protein FlhB
MRVLNLQFFAGEKTEKATPRRQREAREKGQVARSAEIPSAFVMLSVFIFLIFIGGYLRNLINEVFTLSISEYSLWELSVNNLQVVFQQLMWISIKMVAPILAVALMVGLLANYIQVGFLFTGETLKMKWDRINPIQGAKRIFSIRSLVELVKSLLKITLVTVVVFTSLWGEKERILILSQFTLQETFSYIGGLTLKLGIYVANLLIVLAIFDYMYQRYEHNKSLRMSKQEIKDEHKKIEGDPLIKSKIRERQRQMAMRRMMQEVPKADVVITNPTHFSVALKYEPGSMNAPVVIAKGQDFIALKIREVAKQHGIILMENKPLARALYDRVEIGESIPEDLFKAVAEVLAYVYRLKGVM